MVHYPNPIMSGLNRVGSLGDGISVAMDWFKAYPSTSINNIAYHLYYSTNQDTVFSEGVKFIIIDGNELHANIIDLTPGQDYWFSMRPLEYNPSIITFLNKLPISHDNVRFYPSSMLRSNISATDIIIPLLDVEGFPNSGIIKIGIELIQYIAVDTVNNNLITYNGTDPTPSQLVKQSNNQYYIANPSNVGQGTIDNLSLLNISSPTETWTIKCIFIQKDSHNNAIPNTAKFEAIGTVSGNKTDGYGNFPVWISDGYVNSNTILTFAINEIIPFAVGDYFTIQVAGVVPSISGGRGFNNTPITLHTVNGYDGYNYYNPSISMLAITEDTGWDVIYACQSRFEYPHYAATILDGYKQVTKDILSTDLSAADEANVTFPEYDYSGYHRTDPVQLLNGTCVGSYIGGQMGCIDAYGNYNIYRGMSLQDQNTQRQDILLSVTGRPACLLQCQWTGIICNCYISSSEYPDDRCPKCFGKKFSMSYSQYFNPRQSDGRIMVRTGPTAENLRMYEAGLESEYPLDIWTLTVPTIKTRDILVLFDQDNNEEFRYEVSDVVRNNTILGLDGGQHLKTFRIRKFDIGYQIPVFRDTADFPTTISTGLGSTTGIPPHTHNIQRNENDPTTWGQLTQISQGHNHIVELINGKLVVRENLGHSHQIII